MKKKQTHTTPRMIYPLIGGRRGYTTEHTIIKFCRCSSNIGETGSRSRDPEKTQVLKACNLRQIRDKTKKGCLEVEIKKIIS